MDSFEERQERGISNMGELLLKGYIMAADSCPKCNCVLFKKTKNSPLFCPICDEKNESQNNTEKNEIIDTKNKKEESLYNDNDNINSIETNVNENIPKKISNSINNKMSELLLAGWTLTNDNCPFCIGVPLMKNKENQQFCVKCEKNFIREEEAKKQGMLINYSEMENKTSVKPKITNIISKHNQETDKKIVQPLDNPLNDIDLPIKKEKEILNSYSDEIKNECLKTSSELVKQLSSLRSKLEVINDNNDTLVSNIQYTINICDAISSVCNAINACNSILNS